MKDQLDFLYAAGATKRFHTVRTLQLQDIANHSWHLTMLGYILYGQEEPGITIAFMMACMTHDMAEHKVGDLPAPGKRGMDGRYVLKDINKNTAPSEILGFRTAWDAMEQDILADVGFNWEHLLTEEEKRRLKLLDALEGMMFCVTERQLGNVSIATCYENFQSYAGKLLEDLGPPQLGEPITPEHREWALFHEIFAQWRTTHGN